MFRIGLLGLRNRHLVPRRQRSSQPGHFLGEDRDHLAIGSAEPRRASRSQGSGACEDNGLEQAT